MKALVLIPARGGSKGVPSKNIKLLNGKPLIQYTIDAALALFPSNDVLVSTDDPSIVAIAESLGVGVPFIRPAELATDEASSYSVIDHALEMVDGTRNYDTLVYLQPTSPLRTSLHIREAIDLFEKEKPDMVVSVKETDSNPYYVLFEEDDSGYLQKSKDGNFTRRQDCPPVFEYNGAIYIVNIEAYRRLGTFNFRRKRKYVMSRETSVDIDTPLDWTVAETIMNEMAK